MNLELLELLYLQTRNQADHSRQGASEFPVSLHNNLGRMWSM